MIASFERHLKKNYGLRIMKDLQFEQTRKALVSKGFTATGERKQTDASSALSEDDVAVWYEKDLLGTSSLKALVNTLWFNNAMPRNERDPIAVHKLLQKNVRQKLTATIAHSILL